MTLSPNVAGVERWASALGGAALAAYGIKQLKGRSPAGAAIAAAGSALMYRGATGRWPVYAAAGISTLGERERDGTRRRLSGSRGVHVEEVVTIQAPADQLYAFWRDFEQLPRFMDHLVSVTDLDGRQSHWVAKAPTGSIEWSAEVINEIPGELIAWSTIAGSDVVSAGSVSFTPSADARETQVRVKLQYDPPAGKLGAAVAWLLGKDPSQTIREDLRRFKQLMEAGEIATTDGQPHGKQSPMNYD